MSQDGVGLGVATKPWWMSRTILAGIGTIGCIVAAYFGVSIDEQTKTVILDQTEALLGALFVFVTTLITIYGRIRATKAIGKAPAQGRPW